MRRFLLVLLCLYGICSYVNAQSKINLINGKQFEALSLSIDNDDEMLYYKISKSNGKLKYKSVLLDEVFSITDSANNESIMYKPLSSDMLSVEEMRSYMKGYQYARQEYSPYLYMLGGFAVGTGSMFLSKNPLFCPVVPLGYCAVVGFVPASKRRLLEQHPDLANQDDLIYGYRRGARSKNIIYSVIGSAAGILVGSIIGTTTGYYN